MYPQPLRIGVAVLAAGTAGTLANAAAAAIAVDADLIRFALVPGRYAVAILVTAALPLLFRLPGRWIPVVAGLCWLTVVPSLLAKLAFGAGAPWPIVLGLNGVFAVAALLTYRLTALPLRGSPAT